MSFAEAVRPVAKKRTQLSDAAGDAVLVEVARQLRGAARPGDLIARLGGDGGGQARPPEALHLTTLTCSGTVNSSAPGTSTSVFWYFFTAVPCLNWMFLAKRLTPTSRQSQAGDRHFKSTGPGTTSSSWETRTRMESTCAGSQATRRQSLQLYVPVQYRRLPKLR